MKAVLFDSAGTDSAAAVDLDLAQIGKEKLYWILGSTEDEDLSQAQPAIAALSSRIKPEDHALNIGKGSYTLAVPVCPRAGNKTVEWVSMIVGENWLITLSTSDIGSFERFLDNDGGDTLRGRLSGSGLCAALIEVLLADFRDEISEVDRAIDQLDDEIFRSRERREPLAMLGVLRRRVARLRSALADFRTAVHGLARPDFRPEVTDEDAAHFLGLAGSFERVEDQVLRARETVVSSFELYATRVAQDTNRLLKTLTVVTVATGIVGALAGVFGMNLDLPFSNGPEAFKVVAGSLFSLAIGTIVVARLTRLV